MCTICVGLCHVVIYLALITLLSFDVKPTDGVPQLLNNFVKKENAGFTKFDKSEEKFSQSFKKEKTYLINRNGHQRFINPANPLNIFGTPNCQHGGYEGTCMEFFQCMALGGSPGRICRQLRGTCCRFFRSCGQRSSQEVTYFSNNKFRSSWFEWLIPQSWRAELADDPPECDFQVVKRTENFCGVRIEPYIDPEKLDPLLSPDGAVSDESCATAVVSLVGLGSKYDFSLCNQRDASERKRYEINITEVPHFKVKVRNFANSGRSGSPVDVKIRQIKCDEFADEDVQGTVIPGYGGGGTSGAGTSGGGTSGGGTSGGGTSGGGTSGGGTSGGGTSGGGTSGGGTSGGETSGGGTTDGPEVDPQPPAPPIPSTERPPGPPAIAPTEEPGHPFLPPEVTTAETFPPEEVFPPEEAFPPGETLPPEESYSTVIPPLEDYSVCGIKGSARKSKNGQFLESFEQMQHGPVGPPITALDGLKRYPSRNQFGQGRQEQPSTWDVPANNETIFAYLMGVSSLQTAARISHGTETHRNEFPWQVAMFKAGNKFHCGASIIGDFYVLTAAHCVINFVSTPQSLVLRLGDWALSSSDDGEYVNAEIERISVHPDYSRMNLQNDIGVIKLKQRIDFNERIRPICLPLSSDIVTDGQMATITGWGKNEKGATVDRLNKLTAVVMDNVDCNNKWGGGGVIVQSMMCMDPQNGDSCNGDSGGPSVMVNPGNPGKYIQVGIVSFGSGSCTDKNLPGVYTRVPYFRDWILQQLT